MTRPTLLAWAIWDVLYRNWSGYPATVVTDRTAIHYAMLHYPPVMARISHAAASAAVARMLPSTATQGN